MYSYGGYVPILSYRTRTVHTAFELNHHDSNELWATPLIVKWNELSRDTAVTANIYHLSRNKLRLSRTTPK